MTPPPCPKLPKHLIKVPKAPDPILLTPIENMPKPFWPKDKSSIPAAPYLGYKVPPVPKLELKPG